MFDLLYSGYLVTDISDCVPVCECVRYYTNVDIAVQIRPFLIFCECVCVSWGQAPNMRGTLYSDEGQIMMYLSTKTQTH